MGREQRKAPRRMVRTAGMIYGRGGEPIITCEMRDVSATGARLALPREIDLPQHFVLVLSHAGQVRRQCQKAWQFSILVGARFSDSSEPY
jgi:hypothetical protein